MDQGKLESADLKFRLMILGILGVAGFSLYSLTRKSEESTTSSAPPVPVITPVTTTSRPSPILPTLDAGLSNTEVLAVQKALSGETKPANLNAFASTFEPMFPIAASLLRQKAAALGSGGTMTGKEEPCCDDCAKGDKPPCTPKVTGAPIFRGLPTSLGVNIHVKA